MTQKTEAATKPFDDCRLPSPGTGDELEDFARSFNGLIDRLHVALERQRQFTAQASTSSALRWPG